MLGSTCPLNLDGYNLNPTKRTVLGRMGRFYLTQFLFWNMKEIPLTRGLFALVDDEDVEMLSQYKWQAGKSKHGNSWYAHTTEKKTNKKIAMHRLICGLKQYDGIQVDHKDLNGLNNQKNNLRLCTDTQNKHNTPSRKGASSKYKGVFVTKRTKSIWAGIRKDGKTVTIGHFKSEKEAAIAYDREAEKLYGEFAYLNFPGIKREAIGKLNKYSRPHKYGYIGVQKTKYSYFFLFKFNGKKIYKHGFKTAIEAAQAYDEKVRELRGENAILNFPEGGIVNGAS